jgi:hypothetical protein
MTTSTANAPSQDIKDMLEDSGAGLGLVFGTNLFVASMPDTPNTCSVLVDTGGADQGEHGYERPSVQFLHRNVDYQIGYAFMRDIKYRLHYARNNEIWNGTRYIVIAVKSDILFLGQDDKNRYQFSLNFRVERSGI